MTPQEKIEFEKMKDEIRALKNSASIPYDVDSAFRTRLGINNLALLKSSSKGATSEQITIDEAGSATKNVLGNPDGFIQTTLNGTTIYLAYWN